MLLKQILLATALGTFATSASAASLYLDMDSPATGSELGTGSWLSPLGLITFEGEITDFEDTEMVAAGAAGNNLDIDPTATLTFAFDVSSITFIYGGNAGVFDIVARDIGGATIDSFFQADTEDGQPAGPVTLTGPGIRSLFWQDPGNAFAAIDNITVETSPVPLPAALPLLGAALAGLGLARRRGGRG